MSFPDESPLLKSIFVKGLSLPKLGSKASTV